MSGTEKYAGLLVEYLDDGQLRAALAMREVGNHVVVADASGNERKIARDLVLVRYPERRPSREDLREALEALKAERAQFSADIDLNLLWEIVSEHERGYTAAALADIFFGHSSAVEAAVMLEMLLNDRLYFVRRQMEFIARDAAQVERLRTQYDKIRLRSEGGQQTRRLLASLLEDGPPPPRDQVEPLIADLTRYLENPFARNRDTVAMLEAIAGEITPAEAAYEILERLEARPAGPRYALIGGVRTKFNESCLLEATHPAAPSRTAGDGHWAVTIDDEETVEIDDAIACEALPNGEVRVRVHIALVADFVPKAGPMDLEAAARGTTVYLPEATVRMLPDPISTDAASLCEGVRRHVLTTDITLSPSGEMLRCAIYAEQIVIGARLTYDRADQILAREVDDAANYQLLDLLRKATSNLRERRRIAGARLFQRREPKIVVTGGVIDIRIIEPSSPSRELVAELMVLSNHAAARWAADRGVPMIYRIQPNGGEDGFPNRARMSLHPEFHAGVGLDCYVQASSPIRRYLDLVLQRQLIATLGEGVTPAYDREELLRVLAGAEVTEVEGRELERRAKRYWTLTYLKRHVIDQSLHATVARDGASAELDDYVVRGALRGAPNLPANAPIMVQIGRVDPVRGLLNLNYVATAATAGEAVR